MSGGCCRCTDVRWESSFTVSHVRQIKHIHAGLYDLSLRAVDTSTSTSTAISSPKSTNTLFDLIVVPHVEADTRLDTVVAERRRTFHQLLLKYVKRYHDVK
jgi:hypothetical protein